MNDRSGILPAAVVNPLTGVLYKAGTQIPIQALNPFAAAVLNQLPTGTSATGSNHLPELLLIRDYGDKFDVKLDGQINKTMTGFLRFSQRIDHQFFQPDIPGAAGGNGNGTIHVFDQNASAGYTW